MTLVIQEDGSYELTGSVNSKGTIEIAPNGKYVNAGPFDLWIYRTGKHEVLEGDGNGAKVAFGLVRASTPPASAMR
jgi:hypothetical protein